eukprot:GHRQ01006721.1.p2 GENE.GHRQ01006721.1~~GHRQ01006721.1.p2  ORF type:complete len:173 (+),score=36.85 GHRQ01006721.1:124-642(+)
MAATMRQAARMSTTSTSQRCSRVVVRAASVAVSAPVVVKQQGAFTCRGTVRKVNEDRYDVKVVAPTASDKGDPFAFVGVYDGHGGSAVAEWLSQNLFSVVGQHWQGGSAPESCIADAYTQADKQLLVSKGFMGLGELPVLLLVHISSTVVLFWLLHSVAGGRCCSLPGRGVV